MTKPIGVILAGGDSKRMGHDKALVEIDGRRMIDLVADALNAAGLDVVVAGSLRDSVDLPVIADGEGSGPVAGLVGALAALPDRDLFVSAVDQPLLREETVRRLSAVEGELVAPLSSGVLQVTCAVYRPAVVEVAAAVLRSPRASLHAVAARVATVVVEEPEWRSWGEDGRSWRSIDSPEDVTAIERLLS